MSELLCHSNFYLFHILFKFPLERTFWEYIFSLISAAWRLMKRLTYHFILLSVFYRCTKQTSGALLVYVPCVFILNKNKTKKTAKNHEKMDWPTGCYHINYTGLVKPLMYLFFISCNDRV